MDTEASPRPPAEDHAALAAALARITALEAEVTRLRSRLADERLADDLRARLAGVGLTAALAAPTDRDALLEEIVRAAMHVLGARAGSLYLVDEATGDLIFEVALGDKATTLRGQRLPAGQGLAGWVVATGQAIAVADAREDRRWASEIGRAVGHAPQAMLALPLLLHDDVIGVLQVLDKEGGATFSAADMTTLGLFARQAAIAIAQAGALHSLSALLRAELAGADMRDLREGVGTFAASLEAQSAYQETRRIAETLRGLLQRGEAERRLALAIVAALGAYAGG